MTHSYKDYLPKYIEISEEVYPRFICPMSFSYYAMGAAIKGVNSLPFDEKPMFVAISFLDTFFNTGLYTYMGRDIRNEYLLRNTVSIDVLCGSHGTVTNYKPHVVLGFHESWSDLELEILASVTKEYLEDVYNFLQRRRSDDEARDFFRSLRKDDDLNFDGNVSMNFKTSLGLVVDERAYGVFKKTFLEFVKGMCE